MRIVLFSVIQFSLIMIDIYLKKLSFAAAATTATATITTHL